MMKNNNFKLYLLGIILLLGSSFILDDSALIVFLALGLIFVSINEFKIPSHIYLIGGIISEIVFSAATLLREFPETIDILHRGTLVVGISAIYAIITSFKSLKNKNKSDYANKLSKKYFTSMEVLGYTKKETIKYIKNKKKKK